MPENEPNLSADGQQSQGYKIEPKQIVTEIDDNSTPEEMEAFIEHANAVFTEQHNASTLHQILIDDGIIPATQTDTKPAQADQQPFIETGMITNLNPSQEQVELDSLLDSYNLSESLKSDLQTLAKIDEISMHPFLGFEIWRTFLINSKESLPQISGLLSINTLLISLEELDTDASVSLQNQVRLILDQATQLLSNKEQLTGILVIGYILYNSLCELRQKDGSFCDNFQMDEPAEVLASTECYYAAIRFGNRALPFDAAAHQTLIDHSQHQFDRIQSEYAKVSGERDDTLKYLTQLWLYNSKYDK